MKIATNELEHLREEVKNCHRIIKDLQKKREFVGLTDDEIHDIYDEVARREPYNMAVTRRNIARAIEAKLKEKNA